MGCQKWDEHGIIFRFDLKQGFIDDIATRTLQKAAAKPVQMNSFHKIPWQQAQQNVTVFQLCSSWENTKIVMFSPYEN